MLYPSSCHLPVPPMTAATYNKWTIQLLLLFSEIGRNRGILKIDIFFKNKNFLFKLYLLTRINWIRSRLQHSHFLIKTFEPLIKLFFTITDSIPCKCYFITLTKNILISISTTYRCVTYFSLKSHALEYSDMQWETDRYTYGVCVILEVKTRSSVWTKQNHIFFVRNKFSSK